MTLLAGCKTTGGASLSAVPEQTFPADIEACLLKLYGPPTSGMTERETALYIAGFNRHDVAKTQCGRRALAWIDYQPRPTHR